jgi:hypothetical protein
MGFRVDAAAVEAGKGSAADRGERERALFDETGIAIVSGGEPARDLESLMPALLGMKGVHDRLWFLLDDSQQGLGGAFWFTPALLPVL